MKSFDEKLYIRETYHQDLYQNKKIVILHVKDDFSKIKKSICKIPIEAANISHILPRPVLFNRLLVAKLKRDFKYRVHVYFEPVCLHIVHQTLTQIAHSQILH